MTKNEMIFDVLNTAYGGEISDDTKVSEEQVGYWIDQTRAMLVEQKFKRGGQIPSVFIQHLECIDMELHETLEGCYVLRSVKSLPTTLGGNQMDTLTSVYAGEGSNMASFSRTSYMAHKFQKYNKFTANARRWYLKDGHLYVTNDETTSILSAAGIFENPSDVASFCSSGSCYSNDDQYPVTASMAKEITSIILKERFGIIKQTEVDDQNNATQAPRNDNQ
jgi:hypothetical protein